MLNKTEGWEYFCTLMMVIPGLCEVFNDYHPGDAEELRYKEIHHSGVTQTAAPAANSPVPPGMSTRQLH